MRKHGSYRMLPLVRACLVKTGHRYGYEPDRLRLYDWW